eukprot:1715577-Amphidinium_carterae.1
MRAFVTVSTRSAATRRPPECVYTCAVAIIAYTARHQCGPIDWLWTTNCLEVGPAHVRMYWNVACCAARFLFQLTLRDS